MNGIVKKIMGRKLGWLLIILLLLLSIACKDHGAWNDPHRKTFGNIRYSSFSEPPKTLDPAVSYSEDEITFIAQIYEPVLQYHYLKRPYELIPLTAAPMPEEIYLDADKKPLPKNAPANQVAFTHYKISIKPHILYQPHPAFAKDKAGNYLYQNLTAKDLRHIHNLNDFKQTGTRELTADDYVYEIKRLANPQLNSPIFSLMSKHIVGFEDYSKTLQQAYQQQMAIPKHDNYFDLRSFPLASVQAVDRYTYTITIRGKYPEFAYWLAMTFFAPIPWEVDKFYSQPGMREKNITFNWYPVGTGPYMLSENNPNSQMVLERNPNFHGELYPSEGAPEDQQNGLLAEAGEPMPFVDKFIFSLEKESIPRWSKFLQGYYDVSSISSDSFDQAVRVDENNEPQLTPLMQSKGIRLYTSIQPSIYYWGFNMLDDVVGGYTERAKKLRQAIAIAINTEEFIKIFLNGRGVAAQGPIPPGIFGYMPGAEGIDTYMYDWQNDEPRRKSIEFAKQLLIEADYPNGRDAKTGKPLVLNYDVAATTAPDDKARFDWMREQFAKLGIQLNIRATLTNRFQEKMRHGDTQIYFWGWMADYPDPENFLFLLYGPNGAVKYGGTNTSNYSNPTYDKLFEQMRAMANASERQEIINQMVAILREDTPWVWGIHLKQFVLSHQWNSPVAYDAMGNNGLKYVQVNPELRAEKQREWNQPKVWPVILLLLIVVVILLPVFVQYRRQQHRPRVKRIK